MVIGIIGESCTGKSTLAEKLNAKINGEIWTGKDWLRLNKNESVAEELFREKLRNAMTGEHIIYVISEKEHLRLLPENAFKVLIKGDLNLIKERFSRRLGRELPSPIAQMLERKHGCFDGEKVDITVKADQNGFDGECERILEKLNAI